MSHNIFMMSRGLAGKVHVYLACSHWWLKQHNLICFGFGFFLRCYQNRKLHANFGEPSAECRDLCPDLVPSKGCRWIHYCWKHSEFLLLPVRILGNFPLFRGRMWGKAALLPPLCRWARGAALPRSGEDARHGKLVLYSQVFPILGKFFPKTWILPEFIHLATACLHLWGTRTHCLQLGGNKWF